MESRVFALIYDNQAFGPERPEVVKRLFPPQREFQHRGPGQTEPWDINMLLLPPRAVHTALFRIRPWLKPLWRAIAIEHPANQIATALPTGIFQFHLPLSTDQRYAEYQRHARDIDMDEFDIDIDAFRTLAQPWINELVANASPARSSLEQKQPGE